MARKRTQPVDFTPVEFYAIRFQDLDFFSSLTKNKIIQTCIDANSMKKFASLGVAHLIRTKIQKWFPDEHVHIVRVRQYAPDKMTVERVFYKEAPIAGKYVAPPPVPEMDEAPAPMQRATSPREERVPDPYCGRYKADAYGFLTMEPASA